MIKPRLNFEKMLSNFPLSHRATRDDAWRSNPPFFARLKKERISRKNTFWSAPNRPSRPRQISADTRKRRVDMSQFGIWIEIPYCHLVGPEAPLRYLFAKWPRLYYMGIWFSEYFDFLAQLLPVLFLSSLAVLQTGKTFFLFFRENSLRRSYIGFVDTYILRLLPLSSSAAIPQNPTRSAF